MAEKLIRIGRVSSVNYDKGMIRVTYPDRDNSVTAELPVFSFTDEYKMPKVGSNVLVLHLSNGSAAGIMMGHYWNTTNTCPVTGEGVFRKELGPEYGDSYIQFKDGKLIIHAKEIVFDGDTKITAKADSVILDSSSGVTAKSSGASISVTTHHHTCPDGSTSGPY